MKAMAAAAKVKVDWEQMRTKFGPLGGGLDPPVILPDINAIRAFGEWNQDSEKEAETRSTIRKAKQKLEADNAKKDVVQLVNAVSDKKAVEDTEKKVADLQSNNIHCWLWPTLAGVLLVSALVVSFALRTTEGSSSDEEDESSRSDDEEATAGRNIWIPGGNTVE
jgi:hypothetical protein